MSVDLLPDSRPRIAKNVVFKAGAAWVPIFCANCGAAGGHVPEENMNFAFYLCDDPCAKTYGAIANTLMMPDEVYWQKFEEAQREERGHLLEHGELIRALGDVDDPLAKLARELFPTAK